MKSQPVLERFESKAGVLDWLAVEIHMQSCRHLDLDPWQAGSDHLALDGRTAFRN